MKNYRLITLLCVFIILAAAQNVQAYDDTQTAQPVSLENIMDQQLNVLNLEKIDGFIHEYNREMTAQIPSLNTKDFIKSGLKGYKFDLGGFFNNLWKYFIKEIIGNLRLLGSLIILAVLCALIQNLQGPFEQGTVHKLAQSICYLVIITFVIASFTITINVARDAIAKMTDFMMALLPTLLTVLASVGGITSVSLFHPILFLAINIIGQIITNIVFPLVFFSAILGVVTNISDEFQVSRLAGFAKEIGLWILSLTGVVFVGIMVLYGLTGTLADGVTVRAAKFLAGTFIPVVGGMFSEAVDTIARCSLLIKGSIGILGVVVIVFLTSFPLLKILAITFTYRFAGAIIQPIGNNKIVSCLGSLANSLVIVFASVAAISLMFFITLTILIGVGDLTVMMR